MAQLNQQNKTNVAKTIPKDATLLDPQTGKVSRPWLDYLQHTDIASAAEDLMRLALFDSIDRGTQESAHATALEHLEAADSSVPVGMCWDTGTQSYIAGRLGIGNTSPGALLQIGGTGLGGAPGLLLPNDALVDIYDSAGTARTIVYLDNANPDVLHIRNNQRAAGGTIQLEAGAGGAASLALLANGKIQIGAAAATLPLTGFGTPTGASMLTNFPGGTATLAQCSAMIAEIVTLLESAGLLAA